MQIRFCCIPLSFDCTCNQPFDEELLSRDEDDEDRQQCRGTGRHHQIVRDRRLVEEVGQRNRNGVEPPVGQEDQGIHIVVPVVQENDHRQGSKRGLHQGKHDSPENGELPCTIDQCRLAQLLLYLYECLTHQEGSHDREYTRKNHGVDCSDEVELAEHDELGYQGDLGGNHHGCQIDEKQGVGAPELDFGECIACKGGCYK